MKNRIVNASRTLYHRGKQKLRRQAPHQSQGPTPHEKQLLTRLQKDGFAVVENFLSASECAELVGAVEGLFSRCAPRLWKSEDGADVRAYAAEKASPEVAQYHADPFLRTLGERYLSRPQTPFFTLANRLRPTAGNLGSGGGWHRDSAAENQFKALLYLTDVGPENGPFQFVPGSHRVRELVRATFRGSATFGQHRFTDQELEEICKGMGATPRFFAAAAGTLIVADTSGIHRGMPIAKGERYVLTNYYYTLDQIAAFQRIGKFVNLFV